LKKKLFHTRVRKIHESGPEIEMCRQQGIWQRIPIQRNIFTEHMKAKLLRSKNRNSRQHRGQFSAVVQTIVFLGKQLQSLQFINPGRVSEKKNDT
jgi:hypothetical protein